ncbi:hypothetical protein ROLI_016470 [Roseobacter fucihabitans]|uniref:Uncharacterized protein n=1 Tax=Roseobacter fucihabitans TaxID=1537242 RepID=A0ABZ2BTC4_9RHOB|nr:hypothetical protein [Roseobacter litoralis]MBC6964478.1 hypothetical protein [Roseobacter litoralis]
MIAEIVQALSIAGVGSLVTLLIQGWLDRRQKKFDRHLEEKREAFVGLVGAMKDVHQKRNEQNLAGLAYWRMRCDLVASSYVRKAIAERLDSDGTRPELHEQLVEALRRDMGLVK